MKKKSWFFHVFLENGWALTLIVLYFDEIYVWLFIKGTEIRLNQVNISLSPSSNQIKFFNTINGKINVKYSVMCFS